MRNKSSRILLAISMLLGATVAYAGSGGTEFNTVYQQLTGWTEGTLGKIIALGMIITGLGMGVLRQSIMGVVVGVAGGLALANAPTVIDAIMGGVL